MRVMKWVADNKRRYAPCREHSAVCYGIQREGRKPPIRWFSGRFFTLRDIYDHAAQPPVNTGS